MHLKRWLTAIVLIPIVASVIYFSPPWFFALFICGVCMVALYEYYGIVLTNSVERGLSVTRVSGFIVGVAIVWSGLDGRFDIICLLICGLLILDGAWALNRYQESSDALETVLKQVTGTVYLALALALAVAIHQKPHGPTWIYFFLIVVFLGDTGAYYAGNYYGRHKLLAAVSPGKTWEGSLGGMAATVASGCLINLLLPYLPFQLAMPSLPWAGAVLFLAVLSICGQAGDLFESLLKRQAGVKDSGAIFPGHGGLLDRIDAVLFAIPIVYIFKTFVFAV